MAALQPEAGAEVEHGPTRVMVDVYGVDPMRAGSVLYAVMARGVYNDTAKRITEAVFIVHGERGDLRV